MSDLHNASPTLDLSAIPEGADWVVGHTNAGLTIHAKVGPLDEQFGDTPQEAVDAAISAFRVAVPDANLGIPSMTDEQLAQAHGTDPDLTLREIRNADGQHGMGFGDMMRAVKYQHEIDRYMLKSMSASLRAGTLFSFNNGDMADMLDRLQSDHMVPEVSHD